MALTDMEQVYKDYAKPVYCYLFGLCKNAQDAEEMTAETFFRAVKSVHRFNGECKLLTWLCQIAKHVWYKELEKRKRSPLPLEHAEQVADSIPLPETELEHTLDKLELYRRMQQLEPSTREVLYLRLSGELSFREIGDVLGKSENWARVTFYRGKERMKKHGE